MVVYADVLVGLNILITYILIVASKVISHLPSKKYFVAIASLLGGFSSLIIFAEGMNPFLWTAFKVLTGAVICTVAFLPKSFKRFIKGFLSFLGVSCLFGGVIYAVEITVNPGNIYYCNGTVYFDMSITYLTAAVLVIYGIFLCADYLLRHKTAKGNICEIILYYKGKSVKMNALIDTGSSIADGTFGRPVTVVCLKAASPLLTFEELTFFKTGDPEKVPESLMGKIRVIPCKAVTGRGLLMSFIPEKMEIILKDGKYTVDYLAVAVTPEELSVGEYDAILNYNIFDNAEREKSYGCIK